MTPSPGPKNALLRQRGRHGEAKVSNVELFFDLVFVYAVTQLSHSLLKDLTLAGALRTGLLFLAVWWVWIYTSWVTNWLDPDRTPVRVALFVLMLAGLVLSMALPKAFDERGLEFAAAYVFMQVGRSLFMLWALSGVSPNNHRNFLRITAWLSLSGLFWLAGGLAGETLRPVLWLAAIAIEYAGPGMGFHVPGLGRSTTADWDVDGGHMAERCSLFIIIALGESLLVSGSTFENAARATPVVAAFLLAFAGAVAMWWIYFDTGAERGSHKIAGSDDPGRLARLAYTYLHLLIVAGIIVSAVADELALAHPGGHLAASSGIAIIGGPALYLAGNALFKGAYTQRLPLSHLVGLALLALLAAGTPWLTPLLAFAGSIVALVVVAVWETVALRRPGAESAHLTP